MNKRLETPRPSGMVQTPLTSVIPGALRRSPAMAISRPSCFTPTKSPS